MQDDSERTTIEITLPRALIARVRELGSRRERSAESLVRESLEAYFVARAKAETVERP